MSQQQQPGGSRRKKGGSNKKKAIPTDREISSSKSVQEEKNLVKWEDDSGTSVDSAVLTLDGKESIGKWDQFETNKKFGYKTTFDMSLYTTTLDTNSEWYRKNAEKADAVAREIEGKTAKNTHQAEERGQLELKDGDEDEEDRYSGVQRESLSPSSSGKYVPPHQRKEPLPAIEEKQDVKATEERRKLSMLNPDANVFKPSINITFTKPAAAPPPAVPAAAYIPVATAVNVPNPTVTPATSFKDRLKLAAQKVVAAEEGRSAAQHQMTIPVYSPPYVVPIMMPYAGSYPMQMMQSMSPPPFYPQQIAK